MLFVLTYDVCTEDKAGRRRLRKIAKACENYGQRVQKSVFEFQLDKKKYFLLKKEIMKIMNKKEDSIRIYRIVEPKEQYVEEYGNFEAIDYENDTLMV
ncbi:CRISPR-associated endonuclease Cas2 [Fuchsiella alkaliacetigena]|uniref:CRISPR-associated endonuclease Cas2 n=1 Tax=Fuchsiella alkaliacetigena TaxID=957042 RepID=UPI00200A49E0|nr:CRISPR-associated endonuclease Cas2 [Fuchsiella alkaliacetigena]MCK8824003.1 CRISPR-associated endonuclease Cas2 [Fuchsiella alkaliacetigena]